MARSAATLTIVAILFAATIAAGHDLGSVGSLAAGTPAASPAACVALIAATPAASAIAPSPHVTAGFVTIEMTDQGFDPASFESAVGQDVRVTLHNRGSRPHTFTIDRLHIDVLVPPGQTRLVTIPTPALGSYTYVSRVGCDEAMGMTGKMFIFI